MGTKDVVGIVAFFIAVLGPAGIGFLVPTRLFAGLLSAVWPVGVGVIMAISYGLPSESAGTWLLNIAVFMAIGAIYGILVFNVKTKMNARRNKAV